MNDPFVSDATRGLKAEALGLSTTALVLLRDLIVQHTGQYYDDRKLDLLADKITDLVALNNASSILDYYYLLKYEDDSRGHWKDLLDKLAVPETYFWRQFEQIESLTQNVLPMFERDRPNDPVHIWSAACCTGEEPLTIAMALDQAGWFSRLDIRISATDASPAMVDRARKGLFGERSMRVIPEDIKQKYFTRETRGWKIDPAVHARVEWGEANLAVQAEIRALGTADVIYCRNVLIYFSDDAIRGVASALARTMPEHGILFLGASESLLRLSTEFTMIEVGSSFAYTTNSTQAPTTHSTTTQRSDRTRVISTAKY